MAMRDNSKAHHLIRSTSNELKSLKAFRSKVNCEESNFDNLKETSKKYINKNLSILSTKKKVFLGGPEKLDHNRTLSEESQKPEINEKEIIKNVEIFKKFLKKLEKENSVESKIFLLINYLEEVIEKSYFFSDVFTAILGVVSEYKNFAVKLRATCDKFQELMLEGKNEKSRKNNSKHFRFKSDVSGSIKQDSFTLDRSLETRVSEKDSKLTCPKIAPDLNTQMSYQRLSQVPSLSFCFKEKVDFHEEFMRNLDEFSESWRQEALKLKK